MKLSNKIAKVLVIGLCLSCTIPFNTFANTDEINTVKSSDDSRAVSTGYIYQTINGVCYRRLWNYTTGEWIDPYWTVCPASSHNH